MSRLLSPRRSIGLAIDIDGVLLRGETVLSGASEALNLLRTLSIPHIFITNGINHIGIDHENSICRVLVLLTRRYQLRYKILI